MPRRIAEELRGAYFWSRVQVSQPHECWPWRGHVKKNGYGAWSIHHGVTVHAHRVAWELTYGAIPDGQFVCHSCDYRQCCNPQHLWLGTHQDNMDDARRKGRLIRPSPTHCRRGHLITEENRQPLRQGCLICRKLRERSRKK